MTVAFERPSSLGRSTWSLTTRSDICTLSNGTTHPAVDEFLFRFQEKALLCLENAYFADHEIFQSVEDNSVYTSLCEDVYSLVNIQIDLLHEYLLLKEVEKSDVGQDLILSALECIIQDLYQLQLQHRDRLLQEVETCFAFANDFMRMIDCFDDLFENIHRRYPRLKLLMNLSSLDDAASKRMIAIEQEASNLVALIIQCQVGVERTRLAFTDDERTRVIDAVEQPCSQFAIHQSLEIVERLYNIGDLAFFANAGVINKPVNKDNYYELTKTSLFGHNTMMEEAQKVDPYDDIPNTGILGRMCDRLKRKGFNVQPITVQDASIATVGIPGVAVDPLLVSAYDTNKFNPSNQGEDFDVTGHLGNLNDANMLQSSLYGETWSKVLQKAIFDNELILKALSTTQLVTTFSDHEYASKLKVISSLIASHEQRGTDQDVFFLSVVVGTITQR